MVSTTTIASQALDLGNSLRESKDTALPSCEDKASYTSLTPAHVTGLSKFLEKFRHAYHVKLYRNSSIGSHEPRLFSCRGGIKLFQ